MDKFIICFALFLSLPLLVKAAITFSNRKKLAGPFKATKIFDGDTLEAVGNQDATIRVRLIGIDAPEAGNRKKGIPEQPYSQASETYLRRAVMGRPVWFRGYGIDRFGRLLAEVFADDKNINLELLRAGLVEVYRGRLEENFDPEPYRKAEDEAKISRRGMWEAGDEYVSPKAWRERHRG